jgi:hypothetical protein
LALYHYLIISCTMLFTTWCSIYYDALFSPRPLYFRSRHVPVTHFCTSKNASTSATCFSQPTKTTNTRHHLVLAAAMIIFYLRKLLNIFDAYFFDFTFSWLVLTYIHICTNFTKGFYRHSAQTVTDRILRTVLLYHFNTLLTPLLLWPQRNTAVSGNYRTLYDTCLAHAITAAFLIFTTYSIICYFIELVDFITISRHYLLILDSIAIPVSAISEVSHIH